MVLDYSITINQSVPKFHFEAFYLTVQATETVDSSSILISWSGQALSLKKWYSKIPCLTNYL